MAKRRSSKRSRRNRKKGGQPETDANANGAANDANVNGVANAANANGAANDANANGAANANGTVGGGLTEVAVPAILLYASSKLKKRQPTNKYMSLKSRQILHWRKKAGRTRRTRRTRRR